MSFIALGLNLILAMLLLAALAMGWRLNQRLKLLRQGHDNFARAVADLDRAAARAEQGLAELRTATDDAVDLLSDRITKARTLSGQLDEKVAKGAALIARVRDDAEPPAPSLRPERVREPEPERDRAPLTLTRPLGLAAARERVERARPAASRARGFDDDLFEEPPLTLGGRR
jgi:hypothetical protein